MDSIHDAQVAVVLNSACKVGRAGISIDSVNIIIMAVRLKSTRMKLSSFCLICTVFVSFIAFLSLTCKRHIPPIASVPVSYTHLRAHETRHDLVCRLLLEKKKN